MPIKKNSKKTSNGFTLIEVLITILVTSFLVLAIFNMFNYALQIIGTNKARIGAISLANEKMERIRNLPYNSIGTVGGIPSGNIPQTEQIIRNGVIYTVSTQVIYIDDPFDGTVGGTPNDLLGNDYKRVRINVAWSGNFPDSVSVISDVAPQGIESNVGGGTLFITVFNANGLAVSGANVYIENTNVNPQISINVATDSEGRAIFPGAPTSMESYKITVTKTGYSTDKTYDRDAQNPNPTKPHASVLEGQKTDISFAIDLVSNLTIYTIRQELPDNWQINTDSDTAAHYNPTVEVDSSGKMYFAWEDYRGSATSPRIYSQKYNNDETMAWASDLRVSSAVNQVNPDIAIDSQNNIYYGWNDDVNGNQDVFLIKRDANGADLWAGSKKIDTGANSADQILPIIDVDSSDNCYVVWQDSRDDCGDIYLHKVTPDGNKGWAVEVKVTSDAPGNCQMNPYLRIDANNNVYVAWTDNRQGNQDIYAQKFDSSGTKLWANDLRVDTDPGAANQNFVSFDFDSTGNIYFSWTDWRDVNQNIYAQKYSADGANLWGSDVQINTYDNGTDQYYSQVVVSGNFVYFAWTDERQGNRDVYAQKYNLDGTKQWSSDLRVNTDNTNSDQYSAGLAVDSAGTVYVTWQDNRAGNFNIYAAKFESPQPVTYVDSVPLTLRGAKLIGTDPNILKYSNESLATDSNGRLLLNNLEWDVYIITTGGGYTIKLSEPVQPINLLPNSLQTVNLNLN
jgi:prepilin-type N-terminal cleavage/methylation domain-containing protein